MVNFLFHFSKGNKMFLDNWGGLATQIDVSSNRGLCFPSSFNITKSSMVNYLQHLTGKYISFRPQGHGNEVAMGNGFLSKFLLSKGGQRPRWRLQSANYFFKAKSDLLTIKHDSKKKNLWTIISSLSHLLISHNVLNPSPETCFTLRALLLSLYGHAVPSQHRMLVNEVYPLLSWEIWSSVASQMSQIGKFVHFLIITVPSWTCAIRRNEHKHNTNNSPKAGCRQWNRAFYALQLISLPLIQNITVTNS